MSIVEPIEIYRVTNPATGVIEATYPTATSEQITEAIASADDAYLSWRDTARQQRASVLSAVAALYRQRADELAAIITREMGKPTAQAVGEVQFSADIYQYYADNASDLLADLPLTANAGGKAWVRKTPIGAVLGVMPWNFPYYQVARFAAPNLLVGNTVLLKPAPQCPESAEAMQKIFAEAGLLPGAYATVLATNEQVAAMIGDPRVAGVSVTGSERAGASVAAVAGANVKKVVLELGGSDPFIILSSDDVAQVAADAVTARMSNAGQSCNAAKRMIVHASVYEEFLAAFTAGMAAQVTGDPTDPSVTYGPLSSEAAVTNLMALVDDAVAKGAKLHTGGARLDRPGAFVQATVLSGVDESMRAYREELFGPVGVVYKVDDADQAVALANATPFGLGAAVFSTDVDEALAVAERLDVGMVWINEREGGGAQLPFGGTKRSGIGRELGPLGIDEFVNKKLFHAPV